MTQYKVNNNVAISHGENSAFLREMMSKGIISCGHAGDDLVFRSFNASPAVTVPNINVPLGALNYIKPEDIEVRTAIQVSDLIAPKTKLGTWGGTKLITIKIKEFSGKVSPDDGTANDTIKSTVNYDFITRGVFPFAGYWGNTDMGRETAGAMQNNLQADDVKSLMNTMAIAQNQIFFNGVSEKQLTTLGVQMPVYGFLNDPNLPAYTTVASNAASSSTYWASKTVEEIYKDVLTSYGRLVNKSGGNIIGNGLANGRGKLKLAISLGSFTDLKRVQSVGTQWISVYEMIKANFGMSDSDFIPVPQFNNANNDSDVFYLIYEDDTIGATVLNVYQELIRAYPIFQKHSELSQKISSQVSGCIVQYPMFIDRCDGIGQSTAFNQEIY